ncbi:MAG: NADH-dependent flavin oxidoreductase [Cardiobacteriaceae bacterium]|nr:NADH-dependent flavin oxidoreductase [Cardiobacteriaceae bacterium]
MITTMNPAGIALFSPCRLNNGVALKNRLVVAPMTHYASHEDGTLSDEERRFIGNRAQGFGMFITAATCVSPEGKSFYGEPEAAGEQHLPGLRETARIIQAQSAKAILQLHHGGKSVVTHNGLLPCPAIPAGAHRLAPSAEVGARAASADDIHALIGAFARAAELAIRAGFDGVEIHGANGFLLQQFYSAKSNRRTDEWGGSREKRMRFPLAVVDAVVAVREAMQRPDFIIGYRFSPEEDGADGLTMADSFALIDALTEKPLQYLHVSLASFHGKARRGADANQTRMHLLHSHINGRIPLIGVGNLLDRPAILSAWESGWAEFIGLGKAVMLNPDLAELLIEGKDGDIITELDPARADRYGIPERLWQLCLKAPDWLPPLKREKRQEN